MTTLGILHRLSRARTGVTSPTSTRLLLLFACAAFALAGCGEEDDEEQTTSALVLDPSQDHYGHSNAEWGSRWWQWVYELEQEESVAEDLENCVIPFVDPTGEQCGAGQDGDVFFLAGTITGAVVRDQCEIPAGRAIFFPVVTFSADNGGLPEVQYSAMELEAVVGDWIDEVAVDELLVEFDDETIPDLERFRVDATSYSYHLPPAPNSYTCQGATDAVEGEIDPAYQVGYYVMLAPPTPGEHVLHFKGTVPGATTPVTLDVTYEFKVVEEE